MGLNLRSAIDKLYDLEQGNSLVEPSISSSVQWKQEPCPR